MAGAFDVAVGSVDWRRAGRWVARGAARAANRRRRVVRFTLGRHGTHPQVLDQVSVEEMTSVEQVPSVEEVPYTGDFTRGAIHVAPWRHGVMAPCPRVLRAALDTPGAT